MDIIADNKALLLRLKRPERVLNVIPKSQVIKEENGVSEVVVKWGLDEARVLKNLGLKDVPSPIEKHYEWPGMFKPFQHQVTTASFLTLHKRAFCFNDPGTGKTSSVIWASDYLMKKKVIRRVLIVCPLSIMQSAWQGDLFKVAVHRTVGIAYGNREKRKQVIENHDYEYVIINYDGIDVVHDEIKNNNFDLIVVDEANAYKNTQTKRWKLMQQLLKPETHLWMLTGTPASQSPMDAYGLAKLVSPDNVPRFIGSWRDKVMSKVSMFVWKPKPKSNDTVFAALQPAIRFSKEECLDLPELMYTTREVELTPTQKKYYNLLKSQMAIVAAGEEITAVNAATALNKLLQLSGGAVYSDEKDTIQFDAKNRLAVLEEVIEETPHKVLVFVPFRHTIEIIRDHLSKKGLKVECIHGDVSAAKRTTIFKQFQETDKLDVLVIQPQSAAHGVTLTAANVIVWWGPVMSFETYAQANARIHRQGQKNKCLVVHLQGSEVERKFFNALQSKSKDHFNLMDLYKDELGL